MPGIVGLITRMPRQRAERELYQMVETLRHESFYVTGTPPMPIWECMSVGSHGRIILGRNAALQ